MDYYIIFLFYMQSLICFFYIYIYIHHMHESKYTILYSIICADYMIIQFISFIYVCTTLYQ